MQIILLRHAETEGNLRSNYVGKSNEPLCEQGYSRAKRIKPNVKIDHVYTSTRQRCKQTAEIMYPNATQISLSGFDEMNFGVFEQRNWQDMKHDAEYISWLDSQCEDACPHGEKKADFVSRCRRTFLKIAAQASVLSANEVHCVIHGGTMMAILSELALPVQDYFEWKSDFCCGYRLLYVQNRTVDRPLLLLDTIPSKKG